MGSPSLCLPGVRPSSPRTADVGERGAVSLPDPSSGPYPGHPSLAPADGGWAGSIALLSPRVGWPQFPSCWECSNCSACGGRTTITPQVPCPARQTDSFCLCAPSQAASSCPQGPDFLNKVTVKATGACQPIKPIDVERALIKQVTAPRGREFCATPSPLRAGTGTCKQCGGSVVSTAVPSLCWVQEDSSQAGLCP